ncbi:MAG TPA: hypothetical protein VNQ73_00080 [Ilumatobacter sp.]|nr:hypothetical protein [Ilumatobacter sp.]
MGQLVGVVEKPSATPGVVRFELNRTLSGMGHERFMSLLDADGGTPSSALARELLSTGKVSSVHVYSNIVTVDLAKGFDSVGLADIVSEMYRYWKPGVEAPTFDDLPADEPAAVTSGGDGESGPELSEAAKRVPPHLLERSRQARAKWLAANGG